MKISVIVPVYKVENYLRRCIDSILAQTYRDFELILVDDGSPDSCGMICDEYAADDNRVSVIHKENGGLSDARNAGLDVASGEYVLFVDSDDYIEETLLETVAPLLTSEDVLVGFNFYVENEIQNKSVKSRGRVSRMTFENSYDRLHFICNELLDYRTPWNVWSKIYSRSIIEKYHLRFEDNNRIYAEDMYFNLAYFPYVKEFIPISEILYHYIVRSESITGKTINKILLKQFEELAFSLKHRYEVRGECEYYLKNFKLIYYKLLTHAFKELKTNHKDMTFRDIRCAVKREISDIKLFRRSGKSAFKHRDFFYNEYTERTKTLEKINEYIFYGSGNKVRHSIVIRLIYKNIIK